MIRSWNSGGLNLCRKAIKLSRSGTECPVNILKTQNWNSGSILQFLSMIFIFFVSISKEAKAWTISCKHEITFWVGKVSRLQGRSVRFWTCTHTGNKRCSTEGDLMYGGLWACSLRKCFNLGSRKCHFQRFPPDIFSKKLLSCLLYPSCVVWKVHWLREKRPIAPSELWSNKR